MKYVLIILLILGPIGASAQKHSLFGDAGVSLARFYPGASLTYNYRLIKHIGIGAGVQVYNFFPTIINIHRFVPAVYGDLRFNIRPQKRNQFFLFLDIGLDFYKHNGKIYRDGIVNYTDSDHNGVYTGLGLGYSLRLAKRRWAPYASLKMISNGYKVDAYNTVSMEQYVENGTRGTAVVSVGVKF